MTVSLLAFSRERMSGKKQSEYDVMGLAMPVGWSNGYFFLESLGPGGFRVTNTIADVLTATAETEVEREIDRTPQPLDDYDARPRVYRQMVARRGQSTFRSALLAAYESRCAVRGCDVDPIFTYCLTSSYSLSSPMSVR